MTSAERMSDDEAKIANMDRSEAKARKKVLKEDKAITEVQLEKVRVEEADYFRSQDRWDVMAEVPVPVPVEGTWHFWKGSDWTSEEKRQLNTAWNTLGIGTFVSASVILNAVFSLHSASSMEQAGQSRLEDEMATKNTTSETNQHLFNAATWGFDSAVLVTAMGSLAAFGTLATGLREYRRVCVEHAERLEKLNRPDETEKRENLENHLKGLEARLEMLSERLAALKRQAQQEMGIMVDNVNDLENVAN